MQCSLKFYLVCGTCIWFMTKFCNHAIWSRIEATWHFVCLPLLYLKILCLFTSHSIVIRYPNRQGFVLQIGNNQDRKDCRKVKKNTNIEMTSSKMKAMPVHFPKESVLKEVRNMFTTRQRWTKIRQFYSEKCSCIIVSRIQQIFIGYNFVWVGAHFQLPIMLC